MQQEEISLADTKRAKRVLLQYVCSYFFYALPLPFLRPAYVCVCCRCRSSRSLGQKKLLLLEIKFCEQQQPKEPERRHSMWHVRRFVCCSTCSSSVYLLFFMKLGVILIVRLEFLKQQSTVKDSNSNVAIANKVR